MNHRQRIYQQAYDEAAAEQRRRWEGPYNELKDLIDERRRSIVVQRHSNEKRWFCEVPNCETLVVREHAPICMVHDRRMHELTAYPKDGAS